jgi:hypothetical protein
MENPSYEDLAHLEATEAAPEDSHIVMTDIVSSTQAISMGRFQDVNLIGAGCIAAIRNHFDPRTVPYVFGGDGATFLVREEQLKKVLELLFEVRNLALAHFGLELRVGSIGVREISGKEIRYGFLRWGEGEVLPFFRGNGIAQAEKIIKSRYDGLGLAKEASADLKPELIKGLSCRLMPFLARRGRILSVYIEPRVAGRELDLTLQQIFKVLGEKGPISRLSPVGHDNTYRPWMSSRWYLEAKLLRKSKSFFATLLSSLKVMMENILGTFLFRFKIKNPVVGEPKVYTRYMLLQSDWIKMDGSLRLVIDANSQEESALRIILGELEYRQKIFFGIHCSESAVMTCHLMSKEGQRHVHFIDGSDGGLSRAANDVKEKKRRAEGSSRAA